ncbi:MAG: HlyD family efflux transporter periplasmic adaptor subunit [Rubrivivax sp.]|nr:HlyD family efflux transporter periplasmic adaptor subunit [Rubrivivax sp.]
MSGRAAPIHSIGGDRRAHAESELWSRFVAAVDQEGFFATWLALLAAQVGRVRAAVLLVGENDGSRFGVAAAWPDPQKDLQYLGVAAQRALGERRGVAMAPDGGEAAADSPVHVAYPIEVDAHLLGAVVLDLEPGVELQGALRQIHWASAWLLDHFRQQRLAESDAERARLALLNELMASALQHRHLRSSALAVANEMALRLRCDRVSIGFEEGGQVKPLVLSNTAHFDSRSDLARALGQAMDEVLDLECAVVWPPRSDDESGAIGHAEAVRTTQARAMLSVPLLHEAQTIGVVTLERRDDVAFDAADQRIAVAVGIMLGPLWALRRAQERPLWRRTQDSMRAALEAVVGPRHAGIKLMVGALVGVVALLAFIEIDHRVSARTVIEGSVQLASVAPFDGFIAAAFVRAGETVRAGQLMARLDERDLKLEEVRWSAEREQLQRKYQVAMAQADRGTMGIVAAQVNQAEAQLALVQEKLTRATLVAPFDGVVVSGDLSQQIGMPVEQGKLLFEVAPLEGFRVVLQVDDRDIGRLALSQAGELVLSSLPDAALPFTVSSVTPVATQVDGRNVFRVEAQLQAKTARLRPGMEGVGKVVVGRRSLLWIWTHGFFDWLRLALWNWTP